MRKSQGAWIMGAALASVLAGCGSSHLASVSAKSAFPSLAVSPPNIYAIDFLTPSSWLCWGQSLPFGNHQWRAILARAFVAAP